MVELTEAKKEEEERSRRRSSSGGAQVFFFPGETSPPLAPPAPVSSHLLLPGAEEEDEEDLESFCILEEEEGSGIIPQGGGPGVRVLTTEGITISDNHFSAPESQVDHLKPPKSFPSPQLKLSLTKLSLLWQIFGGNDFSSSKEMACNTRARLEQSGLSLEKTCKSQEQGPNIGRRQEQEPRRQQGRGASSALAVADSLKTRGGPGRNSDLLLEVCRSSSPPHSFIRWWPPSWLPSWKSILPLRSRTVRCPGRSSSCLVLRLETSWWVDLYFGLLFLQVGSEINKLLHSYSSKTRPRQSSAPWLHIKWALHPLLSKTSCTLQVP